MNNPDGPRQPSVSNIQIVSQVWAMGRTVALSQAQLGVEGEKSALNVLAEYLTNQLALLRNHRRAAAAAAAMVKHQSASSSAVASSSSSQQPGELTINCSFEDKENVTLGSGADDLVQAGFLAHCREWSLGQERSLTASSIALQMQLRASGMGNHLV